MTTRLSIILFLLFFTTCVQADIYIQQESHTDSYYYGGITHPEVDEMEEVWIGDNVYAYITERRNVIVDLNRNMLMFINHRDSTYVKSPLPFNWPNLVSDELAGRLQMFQTTGTLEESEEVKKIGKWECQRYDITSWIPYEGNKYDEKETVIWVTLDVPFDLDMYGEIIINLRQLMNYNVEFVNELATVKGFLIAAETMTYVKGFGYQSTDRVIDISEKMPPADVYAVPKGYTEKEELTLEDLQ